MEIHVMVAFGPSGKIEVVGMAPDVDQAAEFMDNFVQAMGPVHGFSINLSEEEVEGLVKSLLENRTRAEYEAYLKSPLDPRD